MAWLTLSGFFLLLLLSLPAAAQAARDAAQPVPVNMVEPGAGQPWMDLRPHVQLLTTAQERISVKMPAGGGRRVRLQLSSPLRRKAHHWLLFSLKASGRGLRRFVVELGGPTIAGSRLALPLRLTPRIEAAAAEGTQTLRLSPYAMAFSLAGGTIASIALEVDRPDVAHMRVWRQEAFIAARHWRMFTAGMLLGMTGLVILSLLVMHALRPLPALPAAALFAAGAGGFMIVHGGLAAAMAQWHVQAAGWLRLAAFFEGVMATGLAWWLIAWLELPRRNRWLARLAMAASGLLAALALWGLLQPAQATAFIRLGFVLVVVIGAGLVIALWRRGAVAGQTVAVWALVALWTLLASVAAGGGLPAADAGTWVSAGLGVVVLALAAVMVRKALSPAAMMRRFLSDAARRALALSAARHRMWDLDLLSGALRVDEELEADLRLPPGALREPGAFEARMQPADLPLYRAAVEAAAHDGAGPFSVQFRLRRADGAYRWYLLRARPLREDPAARHPTRLIGALSDITALRRSEERLLSDAVRDRVTGLPNRPLLLDRLGRAMRRAEAGDIYLIVIDIERFRNINDAWGFEAGDALLAMMARRMAGIVEEEDTLARLPGDQFAIIMDATEKPRDVTAFAMRLRDALQMPFDLGMCEVSLNVSLGIAHIGAGTGLEAEDILKQAEIALFEARRKSGGSVAFFEERMLEGRTRMASMEQDLRRAVERGEVEVVYQPIMDLQQGRLAGFEALVRWQHPVHGLIPPDDFIPLAEEIGLVHDISRVVLEEAVRNLGVWQRAFRSGEELFVAVNISSVQLLGARLVEDVSALLEREGIAPQSLKLELTESLILENPELGRKVLERIAELGVRIACDDFGTGYSAFSSLRDLPFSTLKIDRAFIAAGLGAEGQPPEERAAVILESIIHLAHALGLDIVAEGVETHEQLQRLRALGCDMAQGWAIGQPVAARVVMEALTGVSLEVSSRGRFAAFRERILKSGRRQGEEELVLPTLPIPPAPVAGEAPQTPPPAPAPAQEPPADARETEGMQDASPQEPAQEEEAPPAEEAAEATAHQDGTAPEEAGAERMEEATAEEATPEEEKPDATGKSGGGTTSSSPQEGKKARPPGKEEGEAAPEEAAKKSSGDE